ncbi:hypothetical protein EIP91_006197 [Steccherinum ochraceum]|uniref:F-box domain-containing protein n=1 Tax=Steccherinum ochraceum TaxID=92696 RepID=A0A4R0RBX7_9APHY|nr:hypothetical protein EIP91_006197 [Steccherinum ochraceum]
MESSAPYGTVTPWTSSATSPSVFLPPELLVEIFLMVLASSGLHLQNHTWRCLLRLLGVCRYWRAIVCDKAALWRKMHVENGTAPRLLQLQLQRSKATPLDLCVKFLPETENRMVELVLPELYRVQFLQIIISPKAHAFFPKKRYDMPLLQGLSLSGLSSSKTAPLFVSTESPLPRLQSLEMIEVLYTDVQQFFRPTITDLRLKGNKSSLPNHNATLDVLLRALQSMPLLEQLALDYALCQHDPIYNFHLLPTVTLHRLQSLEIQDKALLVGVLLHQLVVDPSSFLTGESTHSPNGIRRRRLGGWGSARTEVEILLDFLNFKLQGRRILGPDPMSVLQNVSIDVPACDGDIVVLDAFIGDHGGSLFSLSFERGTDPGLLPVLGSILRSFDSKVLGRITKLCISGDGFNKDLNVLRSELRQVVECLPAITTLSLSRASGWDWYLIKHLSIPHRHMPFPELRHVTLIDPILRSRPPCLSDEFAADNYEDLVWPLSEVLRTRARAEIPLETLHLRNPSQYFDSDVELLQLYVGNVILHRDVKPLK